MSGSRHRKPPPPDEAGQTTPPTSEQGRPDPADEPTGEEEAAGAPARESDAPAGQTPPDIPEASLAESRKECRGLKDRLQHLAADFSNYQKRMQRRLEEEKREAVRSFLRDLLPVIDNFERALAAADEGGDPEAFRQGVRMVHDQLLETLATHGVEPIDTAGRRFDPEHHEAVAHVPSEEHPNGHVVDEVQRGYRHGERTLRPSRVAVSRGPAGGEADESNEAEEQDASREGD